MVAKSSRQQDKPHRPTVTVSLVTSSSLPEVADDDGANRDAPALAKIRYS